MSVFTQFNRLRQCRHGKVLFNVHDIYVGRSLDLYGEFSEGEADVFRRVVGPGHVAVEVGANIGAHTLLLAHLVGPGGSVLAFEPQRVVFQTLCANLALNSVPNVRAYHAAVGREPGEVAVPAVDYSRPGNFGGFEVGGHADGEKVPVLTVDGLGLPRCDFLKVDVEGMEQEVLEGAARTIAAHSPVLYVENDREDKSAALVRFVAGLGYSMYAHRPPLFNPDNYAGNPANVFGGIVSINLLCLPKAGPQGAADGLDPVPAPDA